MVAKGTWVQIENTVLEADKRAEHLPQDTKQTPLLMWVKGYSTHDAEIGDEVEIRTVTGRVLSGKLVEQNPRFSHDFGDYVEELGVVRDQVKSLLFGEGVK